MEKNWCRTYVDTMHFDKDYDQQLYENTLRVSIWKKHLKET